MAYSSVGSGAGVAQIQANTVDFGDSDAFMTDFDIAKAKGPIVQIPLVQAPVVVIYNLPGIASGLKFDGDTLGKIFSGGITMWNDPAIKALNPGITPAEHSHRSRPPLGRIGDDRHLHRLPHADEPCLGDRARRIDDQRR